MGHLPGDRRISLSMKGLSMGKAKELGKGCIATRCIPLTLDGLEVNEILFVGKEHFIGAQGA